MHPLLACVLAQLAADLPPAGIEPLPSARQLRWQAEPYYAFVHFNMNTFTDHEWGDGQEPADSFQPSALDCRQWVQCFRDAGMSAVILTAKHHDGFCLWPTNWSEHSVAHSSWRNGQGDVVRELAEACREFGLKLGLYLSPWDRFHPAYGDSQRYNEVFRGQLSELLSNYGEVCEVWFDGACGEGPNGKRQVYDWVSFVEVVRRLQPGAVIFSDAGPDIRWVGNEAGIAGETNWSLLRRSEFEPGTARYRELTEGHADGTHWLPAECDVSIRPGWYWHAAEDTAQKSVEELLHIWDASVGRNAALLLNIPVDRRGLVHDNDRNRLLEFRAARAAIYEEDRAQAASISASHLRGSAGTYRPENVLDSDPSSYWACPDGITSAWLELSFTQATFLDRIWLEEYIALGQRVQDFQVVALEGDQWREIARGSTIGARRILSFGARSVERLRVVFDRARGPLAITKLAAFLAPPKVEIQARSAAFLKSQQVKLRASTDQALIYYSVDGSTPTANSSRYEGPLTLSESCTVQAIAVLDGKPSVASARRSFEALPLAALRPGVQTFVEPRPGLAWRTLNGNYQNCLEWPASGPAREGLASEINLGPLTGEQQGALEFSGFLQLPDDRVIAMTLRSDDGSRLELHGELLIDNDGLHSARERTAEVALARGLHPLRLRYFNAGGAGQLELLLRSEDGQLAALPASWLKH